MTKKKPPLDSGRYEAEVVAHLKTLPGYRDAVVANLKKLDACRDADGNLADGAGGLVADIIELRQVALLDAVVREASIDERFRRDVLDALGELGKGKPGGATQAPDRVDSIVRALDGFTPPLPYALVVSAVQAQLKIGRTAAADAVRDARTRLGIKGRRQR